MKKTNKRTASSKLRLEAEAVRMLSGVDMKAVGGGCTNSSCEGGPVSRIETSKKMFI